MTVNLAWIGTGLALITLALGWAAVRMIRHGRALTGGGAGLIALALGAASGLTLGLATAFTAIDRLTAEQELGVVEVRQAAPAVYTVGLAIGKDSPKYYRLAGDHWQLDIRFLRWQLPARLMGADSVFQLDRLSGRYADPADLAHAEITAYGLADAPGQLMWRVAKQAGQWLPWVDVEYGNGVYMPMADGARYRISVTDSGLVARPDNPAAEAAASSW